ncbi:MAG TPA: hypothetical protein VFG10_03510 [Saprospiraceae bacterium]|nr:hypothetical protein [Saprospiraceae bacterium]
MEKPVWTFEKTTTLKVNEIESILFDIKEGQFTDERLPFILKDKTSCNIKFIYERYVVTFDGGHTEYISIDKSKHTLTIQGEWWYKGVYSFQQLAGTSLISLKIFNVSKKVRWAASLMILPEKQKHKIGFDIFIKNLDPANTSYQL